MTISRSVVVEDLDFIWWRDRRHRPSRLEVPIALYHFQKNNIIVVKKNPFNLSGGCFGELIKSITFENGMDLSQTIVLSMPSSDVWGWHTFMQGDSILGGYKPLETAIARDLIAGKIDFTPYLALPKKNGDPKIEVTKSIKTH